MMAAIGMRQGSDERRGTRWRCARLLGAAALAAAALAGPAMAQAPAAGAAPAAAAVAFDIPAQPLAGALTAFGLQSGYQVSVDQRALAGLHGRAVSGRLTPEQALDRLLSGTGLVWRLADRRSVVVSRLGPGADDGAPVVGPIDVQVGPGLGLDRGRTEGTGAYASGTASVAGPIAAPLRETPHSVSVVTRQRIEDQNMRSVEDALRYTTGVTVQPVDSTRSYIYSRGYQVTTAQLDGIPISLNSNFGNALDLVMYDRVEVLRGPLGLLQGAGEPSAALNLVRRRPLDHFAVAGMVGVGSWSAYRGEADITGPLVPSGRIRGRLIAATQDRGSFIDTVHDRGTLAYGTLEFDLTEATTLSIGGAWQEGRATPNFGLPAYADGRQMHLPRSTYVGPGWNRWETERREAFAELEHRFDNGGHVRLSGRFVGRSFAGQYAYGLLPVDAATGEQGLFAARDRDEQNETGFDAHVTTPFTLFGLTHNLLLGAAYNRYTGNVAQGFGPMLFQNIRAPDRDLPEPFIPFAIESRYRLSQTGLYGQLRLKPHERVTLVLGGRVSSYDYAYSDRVTGTSYLDYRVDNRFTPYAGIVVDLTDTISAYVSYADIFQPQSTRRVAGDLLPPRIGAQYEAGLNGSFLGGALNAHVALFRIRDENRSIADTANPRYYVPAGLARSQGVEAEVSGRILPGWNIAAGYAYTETEILRAPAGTQGQAISSITPRHSAHLWTQYRFQEGPLERFSIGAGIRAVSSFYRGTTTRFTAPGHAVASAQIGYHISDNLTANLTVNNIFDTRYVQAVGGSAGDNYYGEPLNAWLTLRASF